MYQTGGWELPPEFQEGWRAALAILDDHGGARIKWYQPGNGPDHSHIAFGYGHQLYFVFVAIPEYPFEDAQREALLHSAAKARANPCVMHLYRKNGVHVPVREGWGLGHAYDGQAVDPDALATTDPVERSGWELQSEAVALVCEMLEKQGHKPASSHALADVFPSIYFEDGDESYAIIVQATRLPATKPLVPQNIEVIRRETPLEATWLFAPVVCAASEADFRKRKKPVDPILREGEILLKFRGLEAIP